MNVNGFAEKLKAVSGLHVLFWGIYNEIRVSSGLSNPCHIRFVELLFLVNIFVDLFTLHYLIFHKPRLFCFLFWENCFLQSISII